MNKEFILAVEELEKEKDISKDLLIDAIEMCIRDRSWDVQSTVREKLRTPISVSPAAMERAFIFAEERS